ncbi:hypothetical protein LZ30DRAFT_60305 [Colletotrichum cereale]|nr:hypothetical protein LZ30DRAFT_60305 [Colletotrichum cereale]
MKFSSFLTLTSLSITSVNADAFYCYCLNDDLYSSSATIDTCAELPGAYMVSVSNGDECRLSRWYPRLTLFKRFCEGHDDATHGHCDWQKETEEEYK